MSEEVKNTDTVNLEEVSSSGRPFLKSGSYSIRCLSCEKQTSKKGNPMLVFKWEICSPESVKDGATGKEVKITGLQLTDWIVLGDNGFPKLKALHKTLKLPMTINKVSPDTKQYIGKAAKVSLSTDTVVLKDDNTQEPILDDENKPITANNYRVGRFNSADLEHTMASDSVAF